MVLARYMTPRLGYQVTVSLDRNGNSVYRVYDFLGYPTYVEDRDVREIEEYVKDRRKDWVSV